MSQCDSAVLEQTSHCNTGGWIRAYACDDCGYVSTTVDLVCRHCGAERVINSAGYAGCHRVVVRRVSLAVWYKPWTWVRWYWEVKA